MLQNPPCRYLIEIYLIQLEKSDTNLIARMTSIEISKSNFRNILFLIGNLY